MAEWFARFEKNDYPRWMYLSVMLIVIIVILTLCRICCAETRLKIGYMDILCKGAGSSPITELSWEHRYEQVGLELGVGGSSSRLYDEGQSNDYMGRLWFINYFITGKVYYEKIYTGVGIGYYDTYFAENYEGKAEVDDEFGFHTVLGFEHKNWFIEGKFRVADLDIESGVKRGIVENRSRLNSWAVMTGMRW